MKDIAQVVGTNIRTIRKERNLTLETLALDSELDTAYLGRLERGQSNITLSTLKKIACALEVEPFALLMDQFSLRNVAGGKMCAQYYQAKWNAMPDEVRRILYVVLDAILQQYDPKPLEDPACREKISR